MLFFDISVKIVNINQILFLMNISLRLYKQITKITGSSQYNLRKLLNKIIITEKILNYYFQHTIKEI